VVAETVIFSNWGKVKMGAFRDITGQKFGRLLVLRRADNRARLVYWHCVCVCGNPTIVRASSLGKNSRSCGCLQREVATEGIRKRRKTPTHGHTRQRAPSAEYRAWSAMKTRCYNASFSDFADYGGRGIRVCDRWINSFENFLEDMGPRPSSNHSLDRIDVNGIYRPGNCRWATRSEQARNRRRFASIDNYTNNELMAEQIKRGHRSSSLKADAVVLRGDS
jgi:hypothetical protein